jgi:hypothetical protein
MKKVVLFVLFLLLAMLVFPQQGKFYSFQRGDASGRVSFYADFTSASNPNEVRLYFGLTPGTDLAVWCRYNASTGSITIANNITQPGGTVGIVYHQFMFITNQLESIPIPPGTSLSYRVEGDKLHLTHLRNFTLTLQEDIRTRHFGRSDNNYQYTEYEDGLIITGYKGVAKDIEIPSTINNRSVIAIANDAFRGKGLTSVIIPNSVRTIGNNAFDSSIRITGGQQARVQETRASDFRYDTNDGKITITNYTGNVKDVVVPSIIYNLPVVSIGREAFRGKELTSVVIPNSVTTIGNSAFANNRLTSVVVPNSINRIESGTFANNQLTSVVIPNSVYYLNGFNNNQLTSITIPDSVTIIGNMAFAFNLLTSITIPSSVTRIEEQAFGVNQLTSVTIPDSVTKIEYETFYKNKLTSVTIGSGVTEIGVRAFCDNKLTAVTIPQNTILPRARNSDGAFDWGVRITGGRERGYD